MKAAVIVLLFALVAIASAKFTAQDYQFQFAQWMIKYQKSYTSQEFQLRFKNFKWNMDFVKKFNADPKNAGTTVGLNNLADLSNAEYQSVYLGTKINKVPTVFEREVVVAPSSVGDTYNITVDWRAKGAVTGIKDQGQCGSCWSFSTTGSTEGAYFLKTGKLVSLSEQNLVDCSQAQGNMGCNGGLMDQAFQYIIANNGIDTEASYPYTAQDGTCQFKAANVGATISSYKDVTSGSESVLMAAANNQPVSVAIDASHSSFQLYTGGVYHELFCSATKLDHGVLVVGYGNYGSKNFWVVKNSWGVAWGLQGYIYMSKDRSNNCGIATSASYPIA